MARFFFLLILSVFCTHCLNAQTWQEWKLNSDRLLKRYDIATASDNLEKAVKLLQQENGNHSSDLDSMIIQLSDLYVTCMRYEKSIPLLKKIIAANEKGGENKVEYIHALTNLAAACVFYEQYDSAYLLLKNSDSLRIKFHPDNPFIHAENQMIFARYYSELSNFDSALACTTEAAGLYKLLKDTRLPELSLALSTAAYISMQMGDLFAENKFIDQFKNMITSAFQTYHPHFLETQINYAECLGMKGLPERADSLYSAFSTVIYLKLGMDNPLAITCFNNRGYNFLRMIKTKDARQQFSSALSQLKKIGMETSKMYFITKNNESLSYMFDGQLEVADAILTILMEMTEKKWGRQNSLYQTVVYNKAMNYSAMGRLDEAASSFIVAGDIYKNKLITDMSVMPEKAQLNMYNMSEIYFQEVPSFLHTHRTYLKDSILLALYAEQSFLKGLISYNQQKVLSKARNSGDTILSEQFKRWLDNRKLLSDAYSRNQPRSYTDSLSLATNLLERGILSKSKSYKEAQTNLNTSYTAISEKLNKDETAIEFIKYRLFNGTWTDSTFYAALIIQPGSKAPVFIDLCTEAELLNLLHPYYSDLHDKNYLYRLFKDLKAKKPGRRYGVDSLYNMVWHPLEKYLDNKNRIFLSPIGLLNLVAFPALPYKNNKLLTDRYDLHRLQRLSALLNDDGDSTNLIKNIELWGAINYNKGEDIKEDNPVKNTTHKSTDRGGTVWEALPSTKTEIADIKKIFTERGKNVKVFQDKQATKERFITNTNSRPYLLHIATHGFYTKDTTEQAATAPEFWSYNIGKSRDPLLRSGLVFAGANVAAKADSSLKVNSAILTSYDIASMNLENVRLATLSACETAMGDLQSGEGVFGLQRALKIAGVDKMILTLWPVDDEKTQIFMSRFYKKLASGTSITTAFSETQRSIRKYDDPEYWAGFILVE